MNSISDTYKTKRDGGIEYRYEATWRTAGENADWDAKVWCGDNYRGHPSGNILLTRDVDLREQVRLLVENSIEIRAGVE